MDQSVAVWLVLALAVIAANLPYFNERLLLVGPRGAPKSAWWRLLELALMALLTFAAGSLLEARIGQRHLVATHVEEVAAVDLGGLERALDQMVVRLGHGAGISRQSRGSPA